MSKGSQNTQKTTKFNIMITFNEKYIMRSEGTSCPQFQFRMCEKSWVSFFQINRHRSQIARTRGIHKISKVPFKSLQLDAFKSPFQMSLIPDFKSSLKLNQNGYFFSNFLSTTATA